MTGLDVPEPLRRGQGGRSAPAIDSQGVPPANAEMIYTFIRRSARLDGWVTPAGAAPVCADRAASRGVRNEEVRA